MEDHGTTDWYRDFALLPTYTRDAGWAWMVWVWKREIAKWGGGSYEEYAFYRY